MREWFVVSRISAGFVAVLVGYTSSAVIIFQAAAAAGASEQQISSWMWALGLGMAISKRLIESFDGELSVSNLADIGPEFVIRLRTHTPPANS